MIRWMAVFSFAMMVSVGVAMAGEQSSKISPRQNVSDSSRVQRMFLRASLSRQAQPAPDQEPIEKTIVPVRALRTEAPAAPASPVDNPN